MRALAPEGPIALPWGSPAIPDGFPGVSPACPCCHRPTTQALYELRVAFDAETEPLARRHHANAVSSWR
jgi:hypothetical protein